MAIDLKNAKVGDVFMCEYQHGDFKKVKITDVWGPTEWKPDHFKVAVSGVSSYFDAEGQALQYKNGFKAQIHALDQEKIDTTARHKLRVRVAQWLTNCDWAEFSRFTEEEVDQIAAIMKRVKKAPYA